MRLSRSLAWGRFLFLTLSLQPDEVLRIVVTRTAENERDEAFEAETFCLKEIEITGAYGEIKLQGLQACKGFLSEAGRLRRLTCARVP